jgi:hypothetical protein
MQACGEAGLLLVQTEQQQQQQREYAGGGDDTVLAPHKQPVATALFDLLANRSGGSGSSGSSEGGLLSITAEFHAYAANLIGNLVGSPSLGGQA